MSRDSEDPAVRGPDGTPIDPKKLHKYLYAGGDPVNAVDPTGRDYVGYVAGVLEESIAIVRATAIAVRTELFEACLVGEVPLERIGCGSSHGNRGSYNLL
jgi:hypothetical protein